MSSAARFVASARVNALLTLVSRVMGLVREMVFGYFFSTGELLSAFRIAFVIPNLARRLFGEGALSAAVVPVLTQTLRERGEEPSRRFVGALVTAVTVLLLGLVVFIEIGVLTWRFFSDDPAVRLTGITLPYMPLICAVALLGSVLNVRGRFAAAAATPILFNVIIIGTTLSAALLAGYEGRQLMDVLCISVLAGGVAQLVLVGWDLAAAGFFPRWSTDIRDPQIRAVVTLMAPMFLGLSAVQLNTLCDSVIAYLFIVVDGERVGPAVLGYAQFLYQFPLGVFGIGLATAIFPVLSAKAAEGDRAGLAAAFERGIRLSLFIALPASIGLAFVAEPLVAVLYQRGAFTAEDTRRVAGALVCYCVGMPAYFAQHVVVRAYYALRDSRWPARIALYMVGLNLLLNLALVGPLQERGLALATSFCAFVQVAWLCRGLKKHIPEIDWRILAGTASRGAIASAAMLVVLVAVELCPASIMEMNNRPAFHLLALVIPGVAAYVAAARWVKIEELDWLLHPDTAKRADVGVLDQST